MKNKILIMSAYYLPGVKAGGPIQSIKNLVDNLSTKFDFYIITSDRDLGEKTPYSNIKIDKWNKCGNANVFYTNSAKLDAKKLINIINSIDYDVLYLNSFFSFKFSILPVLLKRFKKIPSKPVILAPRGEFSKGALNLKKIKKKFFIHVVKLLSLYNEVIWHATSKTEVNDIQRIFTSNVNIRTANNLTANYEDENYEKKVEKKINEIKIVFISRIHPKKNLKKAIEFLKKTNGKVTFNIFGPIEDNIYWSECLTEIKKLPKNVKVNYKGMLDHEKVIDTFRSHHVFLFPTLGENYGHVISEALIGGCPVIISDQTPWRNLEYYGAGKDISLRNEKEFITTIQEYIEMDNEEYRKSSYNAFKFGKKMSIKNNDLNKYLELFMT